MLNKQTVFSVSSVTLFASLLLSCMTFHEKGAFAEEKSKGAHEICPFEQNRRLGRGINVNCDERLRAEDFRAIKAAGFQSVRLVVNWAAHSAEIPPYTIEPSWFERVDRAVEQSLSQGLPIVLDFHYYPLFSFTGRRTSAMTYEEARDRFYGLWEQVTERYSGASTDVFFEIMNEPSNYLGPRRWNEILNRVIEIIRASNSLRTIVVGPECWQSVYALESLMLPEDDHNIIVAIHSYVPLDFTHQGASYVDGAENWTGTTWTKNALEEHELLRDFYLAAAWAEKHHRPLYLNEFGAIEYADMESRVRYNYFVTRLAEKLDMSWAYWAFVDRLFGIYDRQTNSWVAPIRDALVPPGE